MKRLLGISLLLASTAQAQTYEEWALSVQSQTDRCKGAQSADAFYACVNSQQPAQPEFYTLPDGSKCRPADWSVYLGKCSKPIPADTVVMPVEEVFHPNGQLYKEHWDASKFCHFNNSRLLEGYEWFQSQLGDNHGLTQLYKYSLRAGIEGCAR